ncbi:MAG TPA: fused MFS/spermidine synthase [Planctomycetota bacterium]|nr:fused MFS/spermidine synthase [Planctomycetota bacterium]
MRRSDVVFFLTGAAALVHETIWARLLSRLLGNQADATAVVLAVFMGGLGLGALLGARPARRVRAPRALFAGLEAFVGAWAVLSPWILSAMDPVDGLGPRALVAGLLLLPPTLAMGATFPLMGRLTIAERASSGAETSRFYGVNTLGACAGAILAPALLMPVLGMRMALVAGACLQGLAAVLVLGLRAPPAPPPAPLAAPASIGAGRGWRDPFLLVPLLFGASSLALEVVLTRVLVTVTGASVYAFAIVLAVYLFGIGAGSAQASSLLRRGEASARKLLTTCGLLIPLLSLLGVILLRWQLREPDLFASLANRLPERAGTFQLWASHALFAVLALLPAALAFGAALPAAVQVAASRDTRADVERVLARVYAANTLGALLGSLGAGFLLLPELGPRLAFAIAILPPLAAALLVPGRPLGRVGLAVAGGAVLALVALRPQRPENAPRLLFHTAGRYEMVAVEETVEPDGHVVRSLRLNGKVEASTAPVDVRLQRLLSHIPGLLHGHVRRALVIGMGTGMTAGSLLDLPTLKELRVVEIEPELKPATALFAEWNGPLLEDPRFEVRFADGRHELFKTGERFDLITADPLHVWARGSSDLYTLEYFQKMAEHLAPGGVASQWIGLYEISTLDSRTVIATWLGAFPHASAWLTAYDLALVGSLEPLEHDLSRVELPERVARALAPVGIHGGADIAALQVAGTEELKTFAGGIEPMRDDRPVLEFRAPFSYLSGYDVGTLAWAAREEYVESLPEASRERARVVRGLLREFLERLPQGLSAAAQHYGRELLALPPLERPREDE